MATRSTKLIGALRVEEGTSIWITSFDDTPTVEECPIAAGLYYELCDDGASDLMRAINVAIGDSTTLGGVGGYAWVNTISSSGVVSSLGPGIQITVSWVVPPAQSGGEATDVRDWLGWSNLGDSHEWSDAGLLTGSRPHSYGIYPSLYLQADLRRGIPRVSQFVPDTGNAQSVHISTREEYSIAIRSTGYPRSNTWTEYHQMRDFHEHAMSGRPFRVYPDTTVTTAYSASNRYGYETMTMVPAPFAPEPPQGNWYKLHDWEFQAHQYA